MTDGASASKVEQAHKVETGKWHQFVAQALELLIRLDIDPGAAESLDDVFTLESSDGAFKQNKTVADDTTPGDAYVDLRFTGLRREASYTLTIDPGKEGQLYQLFKSVPGSDLGLLSPDDDAGEDETSAQR